MGKTAPHLELKPVDRLLDEVAVMDMRIDGQGLLVMRQRIGQTCPQDRIDLESRDLDAGHIALAPPLQKRRGQGADARPGIEQTNGGVRGRWKQTRRRVPPPAKAS